MPLDTVLMRLCKAEGVNLRIAGEAAQTARGAKDASP